MIFSTPQHPPAVPLHLTVTASASVEALAKVGRFEEASEAYRRASLGRNERNFTVLVLPQMTQILQQM